MSSSVRGGGFICLGGGTIACDRRGACSTQRPFPPFRRIFPEVSPIFWTNCSKLFSACFPAGSPSPQERLLGLQGGGTGAGGGDNEETMLASLAPEGTREWHDRRSGLPAGATKMVVAGQYEQVGCAYRYFRGYSGTDLTVTTLAENVRSV